MSIATEIEKLQERRSSIIEAIRNKGVTMEDNATLADCVTGINNISGGGRKYSYTGHVDSVGLSAIGWTQDDIDYYQQHGVNWNEEDDDLHLVSDYNIALYTNATKVTYQGIEMADGSYFKTFKENHRCMYFPKVDTHSLSSLDFKSIKWVIAIPKLHFGSNVTRMNSTFASCYSLTSVDLSGFDTSNVTSMNSMFSYCYSFVNLNLGNNFKFDSVSKSSYLPFNSISSSLLGCNFNSVKNILSAYERSTVSYEATISFGSDSIVTDDATGTLATLKSACEAKNFTISNLTIE